MIKRTYFFSCQCPKNDGYGSYSYFSTLFYTRSFFADEFSVYEQAKIDAASWFKKRGIEQPSLDIQAFNRV